MNHGTDTPSAFPQATSKNKKSKRSLLLVGAIGTVVLGATSWLMGTMIGFFDAHNGTKRIDGLAPILLMLLLTLAFAAGLVWSVKFWRTIDEAARRAHLDAFYWGGPISWMVLAPLVVLPRKIDGFTLAFIENLDLNASQIFGLGICAAIVTTLIGYGIAWLVWWASKR